MDERTLPPNWKDLPLTLGPRLPMLDDGQPMTVGQMLIVTVAAIAAEQGAAVEGRLLLEIANSARSCILLLLAKASGEPLNTFIPNGDGL